LYFSFQHYGTLFTFAIKNIHFTLHHFTQTLTRQRTGGSLVRLVTPTYKNEDVADADKRLVAFTKEIVPVLKEFLPQ